MLVVKVNNRFMVSIRNAAPSLLAEVKQLREDVRILKEALGIYSKASLNGLIADRALAKTERKE